jgi:hypothetical protein
MFELINGSWNLLVLPFPYNTPWDFLPKIR